MLTFELISLWRTGDATNVNMNEFVAANPQALLNTNWLNFTMHFGLRGRQEHIQLLWGDQQLKTDSLGLEYVEFKERSTKTRQGNSRDVRAFQPKMYSTGKS